MSEVDRPSTASTPFISVVVPVFRAERALPVLCERLSVVLSNVGRPYEIILVDDRSPDRSWLVIREMAALYPVVGIRLSRNFGQHYAITAGMDAARGEWTVLMDCDLEDRPEEIPTLLAAAEQGHDLVLARRVERTHGPAKRFFSRLFYRAFDLLSGYHIDPTVGAFRIMRRNVVAAFCSMREESRLFGGMVEWLGFDTVAVDVTHGTRFEGRSNYSWRKLIWLALQGITSFSNRPLYLSIVAGVVFSMFATGFGASLLVRYLLNPQFAVSGWLTMVTLTTFIGGLILVNLGVLGVYVGRIYDQTKQRPLYVIDQVIGAAVSREGR